ncbi:hypothetical protein Q31a_13770 [Aureliella helgolandensis]|uniref:DUF6985 domain-containing protein n=1 Tax=Aureliella helgolandensis TaxID=2527968 RepID=A0A518G3B6_9BACT|nr:hypothetical protein [Aureliella helgolandensis]QDV23082.1 hypothetical protein Q31a_13770 [Aureliella helgolandensis]
MAIKRRAFRDYAELQTRYADFVTPSQMPNILAPDGLNNSIGFAGVHFHRAAKDGVAYMGIYLNYTWDIEHALGLMMHKDRIVEFGGADTAILEWMRSPTRNGNEDRRTTRWTGVAEAVQLCKPP